MKSASSRSAKPQGEKRISSTAKSGTDWSRLKNMTEKDIKLSEEHPEAEVKHIVKGIVRRGLLNRPGF